MRTMIRFIEESGYTNGCSPGVLGDVPPDVDAAVPIDPHKTLRERMEPLRAAVLEMSS